MRASCSQRALISVVLAQRFLTAVFKKFKARTNPSG
jgi:hypothetical protein